MDEPDFSDVQVESKKEHVSQLSREYPEYQLKEAPYQNAFTKTASQPLIKTGNPKHVASNQSIFDPSAQALNSEYGGNSASLKSPVNKKKVKNSSFISSNRWSSIRKGKPELAKSGSTKPYSSKPENRKRIVIKDIKSSQQATAIGYSDYDECWKDLKVAPEISKDIQKLQNIPVHDKNDIAMVSSPFHSRHSSAKATRNVVTRILSASSTATGKVRKPRAMSEFRTSKRRQTGITSTAGIGNA
jgi:hypothetical protein